MAVARHEPAERSIAPGELQGALTGPPATGELTHRGLMSKRTGGHAMKCRKGPFAMTTRARHERKRGTWKPMPHGGRLYSLEIDGKMGWKAVYFKQVDASENTLRFCQAIYDSRNRLGEIHEKFPHDLGHRPAGDSGP